LVLKENRPSGILGSGRFIVFIIPLH